MTRDRVLIIAEAGVNHDGSIEKARRLVDIAAEAGADAVKFQCFTAQRLVCRDAPKAAYQLRTTGGESQFEMLRALELSHDAHRDLMNYCQGQGIEFLSSPFDEESARALCAMGLKTIKVPSGELTNLPLLQLIGEACRRVLLSTGMANMEEIRAAIDALLGAGTRREDIVLLHCHTEYPTRFEDANLRAMLTMREAFDLAVGYSDHTTGIEASVAAAALGAQVIEKHFTILRSDAGPDHAASLEPDELASMIQAIRNIEAALGSGEKAPTPAELANRKIVRKSLVASRPIRRGEPLTRQNVDFKRPGTGISPARWADVQGFAAVRDFSQDELIEI